jgi:hypothetical protein
MRSLDLRERGGEEGVGRSNKCGENYVVRRIMTYSPHLGRAVAQAVRRWLPSAAARVRVRAACGVCGGPSGTGAGFL